MNLNKTTYSPEFKLHIVKELMATGRPRNIKPIALKYGISPSTISQWRDRYFEYGEDAFDPKKRRASRKDRIKELEKRNAELEEEIEILKKAAAFLAEATRK